MSDNRMSDNRDSPRYANLNDFLRDRQRRNVDSQHSRSITKYFISYYYHAHNGGAGMSNTILDADDKLTIDIIRWAEESIAREAGLQGVCILNITPLEK